MTNPELLCLYCGQPVRECNCGYRNDEFDEPSPEEEARENCSQFIDAGYVVCGAIGSEDCDWCPFHHELGTKVDPPPEDE